ncbi:hypothetical protein ScPMuIL_002351 [Solemya velum]
MPVTPRLLRELKPRNSPALSNTGFGCSFLMPDDYACNKYLPPDLTTPTLNSSCFLFANLTILASNETPRSPYNTV